MIVDCFPSVAVRRWSALRKRIAGRDGRPSVRHPLTLFMQKMSNDYDCFRGGWRRSSPWNWANAVEVLARYALLTGDDSCMSSIRKVYDRHQRGGFFSEFRDEEGWWALAWLKVYDLTQENKYLCTAEKLFDDMAMGWDKVHGGGLWWTKQTNTYKNAITNELFMLLAARLFATTRIAGYRTWAIQAYTWFMQTNLLNDDNLVNDGLDANTGDNNRQPTWTHNQGVLLGALAEMAKIVDPKMHLEYMGVAFSVADAVMDKLVQSHHHPVLVEAAPPIGDSLDICQFKGVFVRYLSDLWQTCDAGRYVGIRRRYAEFVAFNAACVTASAGSNSRIGFRWHSPPEAGNRMDNNSVCQLSGVDCLLADRVMNRILSSSKSRLNKVDEDVSNHAISG